jgi:hypothetical protein
MRASTWKVDDFFAFGFENDALEDQGVIFFPHSSSLPRLQWCKAYIVITVISGTGCSSIRFRSGVWVLPHPDADLSVRGVTTYILPLSGPVESALRKSLTGGVAAGGGRESVAECHRILTALTFALALCRRTKANDGDISRFGLAHIV